MSEAEGERLQKVLARAGFGSRRICEELIAEGRVTVNGEVAVLGRRVDVENDLVAVDGAPVGVLPGPRVLPAEQAGRRRDDGGRPRRAARPCSSSCPTSRGCSPSAASTCRPRACWCSPTTASSPSCSPTRATASRRSTWPRSTGSPGPAALRRLREGVVLDDGETTAPARVAAVSPGVLRIVIHEGRNRQVRRMCEAVGHPVVRLVRTRIGPISRPLAPPGLLPPAAILGSARPRRGGTSPAVGPLGRLPAHDGCACGLCEARPRSTRTPPSRSPSACRRSCRRCWNATASLHDDVVSILFTATDDVVSMFPATAARALGLGDVPLICARELAIIGRIGALYPGPDALLHRAGQRRAPPRLPRGRPRPSR